MAYPQRDDEATDPLAELEVDIEDVNRQKLASLLKGRARIDPEAGRYVLEAPVRDLRADRQIIVALLAQLALRLRQKALGKQDVVPAGLSPRDLVEAIGMPGGTVRPKLRNLDEEGLVWQNGEQGYSVRGHMLDEIERLLKEESQ